MIQITSVYRKTAEGAQAQAFAADLARRLGCEALNVYVRLDPSAIALPATSIGELSARELERIPADVRRATGFEKVVLAADVLGGIIVDHGALIECEEVDTLYPRRETSIVARGQGPVLIPFGDSLEAMVAAERGFALAKALALPVVLYHTTWKDATVGSHNPEDHMCPEAEEVSRRMYALADSLGVECKSVIETADDVVEGIIRCAMRESARLIVMSRSSKTTVGCYVDQAVKQSPVPLLAIAALDRRRV